MLFKMFSVSEWGEGGHGWSLDIASRRTFATRARMTAVKFAKNKKNTSKKRLSFLLILFKVDTLPVSCSFTNLIGTLLKKSSKFLVQFFSPSMPVSLTLKSSFYQ